MKNDLLIAEWEARLKSEGLGTDPTPRDALSRKLIVEYKDRYESQPENIDIVPQLPTLPTKTPCPPELVAKVDPACDPRSGGVGGYGTTGIRAIRDKAGYTYNPSSFFAKMCSSSRWNFVKTFTITKTGKQPIETIPQSVVDMEKTVFFTNVGSAEAAGEVEREQTSEKRRIKWTPGWSKKS